MACMYKTPQVTTAKVFHAGTARNDAGELVAAGGRVLGVTALEADAAKVHCIHFFTSELYLCHDVMRMHLCLLILILHRRKMLHTRGSRQSCGRMRTTGMTLVGEQWSDWQYSAVWLLCNTSLLLDFE